ncbi:MAG: hypothetical protein M3P83_04305 [Actinomycetota bacterium]|nr:hypothetical protein [Actinomycetota bacterium]
MGYQAEVDRATQKLQRRYERAKKAADAARFRRDRAALIVGNNKLRAQRLADAEAALLGRLAELEELERMMQANPYASLAHRGREGWTKVPR